MRIKSDKKLTYRPGKGQHSFTIRPEMGVVKHFPAKVCKALIEMGARDVSNEAASPPSDPKQPGP